MSDAPVLETERLRLRAPVEADFDGFCALMSDPIAAEHIGGVMNPPQTWRTLCLLIGHWQVRGFGFFTVEDRITGEWLGRVGPWFPHGWPAPEIGWAIARPHWGRGVGPEAATAAIDYAFDTLGWADVTHMIDPANVNSKALARKLGSVDTGRDVALPGFGVTVDLWGQSRMDWRKNRKRLAR